MIEDLDGIRTAAKIDALEALIAKYDIPGGLFPDVATAARHEIALLQGASSDCLTSHTSKAEPANELILSSDGDPDAATGCGDDQLDPVIPTFLKSMSAVELKAFVRRFNDLTPGRIREMRRKREEASGEDGLI